MTTKVNRQTQFTNLAKHHNRCGLTDVETTKQFEDFPINIRNWKFPKDISKEEMYVYTRTCTCLFIISYEVALFVVLLLLWFCYFLL